MSHMSNFASRLSKDFDDGFAKEVFEISGLRSSLDLNSWSCFHHNLIKLVATCFETRDHKHKSDKTLLASRPCGVIFDFCNGHDENFLSELKL